MTGGPATYSSAGAAAWGVLQGFRAAADTVFPEGGPVAVTFGYVWPQMRDDQVALELVGTDIGGDGIRSTTQSTHHTVTLLMTIDVQRITDDERITAARAWDLLAQFEAYLRGATGTAPPIPNGTLGGAALWCRLIDTKTATVDDDPEYGRVTEIAATFSSLVTVTNRGAGS